MINLICIIIKHLTGLGHTGFAHVACHCGETAVRASSINILWKKAYKYSFYPLPTENIEINTTKKRRMHPG